MSIKRSALATPFALLALVLGACAPSAAPSVSTPAPTQAAAPTSAAPKPAQAATSAAPQPPQAAASTSTAPQPTQASAAAKPASDKKVRVAFVYVGPVGDAGFTYSHELARQQLEKALPYVETTKIESIPETPADAEPVFTNLAEQGYDVIVATAFGYQDTVLKLAQKYPKITWLQVTGIKTAQNVEPYNVRMYQAYYLEGLVAGKTTKSNTVGFVAAHPIPPVLILVNAYAHGVRDANPNATVRVVWTDTWYDPAAEKEAAKNVIAAGADVVGQVQDSPSAQQAADESGKYSTGVWNDMTTFAPKFHLVDALPFWSKYYIEQVQAVHDGTWKSQSFFKGIEGGYVGLGPYTSNVPQPVRDMVEAKKKDIADGKFEPYKGPIKDQNGNVVVPEGKTLTDDELNSLYWLEDGVVGTLPPSPPTS